MRGGRTGTEIAMKQFKIDGVCGGNSSGVAGNATYNSDLVCYIDLMVVQP
jgi:hypothetical protein